MLAEAHERLYLPPPSGQREPRRETHRVFRRRKGLVIISILLAFGLAMLWTVQSIWLVLKGYELANLKKEISALQQANERLQLEVTRLKSPEYVAQVATTRLGMVKPTSQDIRFLPENRGEHVEVAQKAATPQMKEADLHPDLHPFWKRVAEALYRLLVADRTAQAAHK
ncbi:MAG: septum formation initiator family protein [Moorellaceae bacterium]